MTYTWVTTVLGCFDLGLRLVECVKEAAALCGHTHVRLTVANENDPAKALYEAAGFGSKKMCAGYSIFECVL